MPAIEGHLTAGRRLQDILTAVRDQAAAHKDQVREAKQINYGGPTPIFY